MSNVDSILLLTLLHNKIREFALDHQPVQLLLYFQAAGFARHKEVLPLARRVLVVRAAHFIPIEAVVVACASLVDHEDIA